MKLAISTADKDMEALVEPFFGRCSCFVIIDTDDMRFEAFDNPYRELQEEAGIQSARFVISKGARVVITGNCGPNAVKELSNGGVQVIVGIMGTVRQVVESYKKGDLVTTSKANVNEYYGRTNTGSLAVGEKQKNDDSGPYPENRPWYGYVRLQDKKPGEPKGGR